LNLAADQAVVDLNNSILDELGYSIDKSSQILEFGCGSGRHVYEYRDRGYINAYGFDIKNYVELRNAEDEAWFRFSGENEEGRIPFPDDYFDIVHSTSVFEHVLKQDSAFKEINRVLKPGGIGLHNYPAKWRPIEPHTFVPFGGIIKSYWYYYFWAMTGIRNQYQKELSISETAIMNYTFGESGIKYLGDKEMDRILSGIYSQYSYIEKNFLKYSKGRSRILYMPSVIFPPLVKLFHSFHTRVLLTVKIRNT